MSGRRRTTKKITKGQITGQKGENLIERIVLDMEFIWRSIGGTFDTGIDGRIELRDARTEEALHQEVRVQSKGYERFTRETTEGFEFLCDAADIDYWMRCPEPVILVCSHPNSANEGAVWYRCVTEWFADARHRAERRIVFRKDVDVFEASAAEALLRLASQHEPAWPRLAPAPPEHVVSNLFPILDHSHAIWTAPTDLRTPNEVRERYEQREPGTWARDYLLKSGRLYSLRDPRSCSLRHLCNADEAEPFDADEWAQSNDLSGRRNWTDLLRRALLQQHRKRLRWHPHEHLFFFAAPNSLDNLNIDGPHGPRQVVKVEHYTKRPDEESPRLKYVRHHAFRPSFDFIDGQWHLIVEPDYLFTYDGERPSFYADQFLAGIKAREKNLALRGHLRLWQHVLSPPPSLFNDDDVLLTIGAPIVVEMPRGINDALWAPEQARAGDLEVGPGQEELAA